MRTLIVLAGLMFVVSGVSAQVPTQAPGEEEVERERRARALLLTNQAKARCAVSIDAARQQAFKDGKPLVVMVGKTDVGCADVADAGAVGVKVREYKVDKIGEKTPDAPRIIILSPGTGATTDADTSSLYVRDVLPSGAKADEVKAAVKKVGTPAAKPKGDAPLNWDVQRPTYYGSPVYSGAVIQDCPTCQQGTGRKR